jgi:hypothetical protein
MEARSRIYPKSSPDPIIRMGARIGELSERIANLKERYHKQGDVLAGRLVITLESERAEIEARLTGRRPPV